MEHFLRITFWIVPLCGFLLAKSLPVIDINDSNIDLMLHQVKCESKLTFYTPSNVEYQCLTAALNCFALELQSIKKDCSDPNEVINPAIELLIRATEQRSGVVNGTYSTECACERWPQTTFEKFLDKMETLLQYLNSDASS